MINGIPAEPGMFTFMAALVWTGGGLEAWCSGFVVSRTAIISAAHCLHASKRDDTLMHANYSASLGSPNRKEGQHVQLRPIIHPMYNPTTSENDISILKPYVDGQQLPFMNYVKPVLLPNELVRPEAVYAMGWGKTTFEDCVTPGEGKTSNILLYRKQRITKIKGRGKQFIVKGFLDQGSGSSTCQGDSGSPIVERRGDTMIAHGILSRGDQFGREIYQQIAPHKQFILEHAPDAQFV